MILASRLARPGRVHPLPACDERALMTSEIATAPVTADGAVTIPEPVRRMLDLRPGDVAVFAVHADGRITLEARRGYRPPETPDADPVSRFEQVRGSATSGLTTDEIMTMMRGEVDEAHEDEVAARAAAMLREEGMGDGR